MGTNNLYLEEIKKTKYELYLLLKAIEEKKKLGYKPFFDKYGAFMCWIKDDEIW